MVILQRWEPIISPLFPSKIPFGIQRLLLHFWKKEMLEQIGKELGNLEAHESTPTYAKIRVMIDGLQPLTKETVIELTSGEEALVTVEYEKLEQHCAICQRLTHETRLCPTKESFRHSHRLEEEREAEE